MTRERKLDREINRIKYPPPLITNGVGSTVADLRNKPTCARTDPSSDSGPAASSPPISLALELWIGCRTTCTWGNLQFRSRERRQRQMVKLFDAHCHLQDPRIFDKAPQLIAATLDSGVVRFAVNGVSEVPFPFSYC